jgi:hypothetical protein
MELQFNLKFWQDKIKKDGAAATNILTNLVYVDYKIWLYNQLTEDIKSHIIFDPKVKDYPSTSLIVYFIKYYDIKTFPVCIVDGCDRYAKYYEGKFYTSCCDPTCIQKLRVKTNLLKYKVENPMQNSKIKKKQEDTLFKNFGVRIPYQSKAIQEKGKATLKEKTGFEHAMQNPATIELSQQAWQNNPNKAQIIAHRTEVIRNLSQEEKEAIQKRKEVTYIKNHGSIEKFYKFRGQQVSASLNNRSYEEKQKHISNRVNGYIKSITDKILDSLPSHLTYISRKYNTTKTMLIATLNCSCCNNEFDISCAYLSYRIKKVIDPCLKCNPVVSGRSMLENDLFNFIKSIYSKPDDVLSNTRSQLRDNWAANSNRKLI